MNINTNSRLERLENKQFKVGNCFLQYGDFPRHGIPAEEWCYSEAEALEKHNTICPIKHQLGDGTYKATILSLLCSTKEQNPKSTITT